MINYTPGSEQGTPQPRDEALAENPPFGAAIDYYLKSSASSPVTLEILDPSGEVFRRYSSEDRPPAIDPNTLNIPAYWVPPAKPLSKEAGMHRWIWDLRPTPAARGDGGGGGGFFGRSAGSALPGTYTVKLTVGGRSYSQPLIVEWDQRLK